MLRARFPKAAPAVAAIAMASALLAAGCNEPTDEPPATTGPTGNATTITIPAGAIAMGTAAYGPNPLALTAGVTVTWYNGDSVLHSVKANDGTFDSGPIEPGSVFVFSFPQSGTHSYFCGIHGQAAESGALQIQ